MEEKRIISHLVAASDNQVIGVDGGLPWHLPDDFRFFKDTTWAMPIIMGRKTFESMKKPLRGRINIVVTTQKDYQPEGVWTASGIDEAIEKAKDADTREIFIIGGGEIFKKTIDLVDKIYLTRVHTQLEGDTFYPEIDSSVFEKTSERHHPKDERHAFDFTFEIWEKK